MRKLLLIPAVFFGFVGIYGAYDLIRNPDIPNLITLLSVLLITALLARAALMGGKSRHGNGSTGKIASQQTPIPTNTPVASVVDILSRHDDDCASAVPAPQIKSKRITYKGKVKGSSYRQTALRKFYRLQENYEPIEYTIVKDTYQGKPCIMVMAEDVSKDKPPMQLGFIAAQDVNKVMPFVGVADVDCMIYGGPEYDGDDKYFGAEVTLYIKD